MAGDWVKMRSNLDTHPKVVSVAMSLNTTELHVVGMLWKVWTWADQHSLDGNAISVTEAFLNRITGVTGFAHALREIGWLEGSDGNLSFPRFTEHNGQTAKARSETAVRVNKHREQKRKCNTNAVTESLPEKRREEKRRIETEEATHGGVWLEGPSKEFLEWWSAYPRRQKQNLALAAWRRAVAQISGERGLSEPEAIAVLLEAAKAYAASPAGRDPNGQKDVRPNPDTWLTAGSWNDDRAAWSTPNGDPPRNQQPARPKMKPLPDTIIGDTIHGMMK